MCHGKHGLGCAITVLVLGIVFLLRDIGLISLGGLSEWTIVLVIVGLGGLVAYKMCDDSCCQEEKPAKKRR